MIPFVREQIPGSAVDPWICLGEKPQPLANQGIMYDQFMQRAIALAIENAKSGSGGPFAAVVVKDGRIIAEGTNRVTSANDPSAHAEIVAIREACRALGDFQLTACDLYATCEPCPMCLGAIYWARPARVFFAGTAQDAADAGFDDSLIYEELRRPINDRKIPMIQMMRNEALEAFTAWKRNTHRKNY